jgi:tetratricopeptide (TPR) repeat protein
MEGEACRTLESIDSLMWQQPDSAFALLQAFAASPEADSLDRCEEHYFQLLASELLYKNYCEQSNRAKLLKAVAYYDSIAGSPGAEARGMSVGPFRRRDASHASAQTTAFLAARAHYINGVGCYERDSVVEACAEYLKTLETIEGNFEEKELVGHKAKFMAYTYNRLGDLFSEQYMMEPAITCYENALVYCRIEATSPQGIANILSRLGLQYDKLGDKEKMRYYYEQALEEMPAVENSNYRDLMAIVALCDYQLGSGIEKPMKTLMEVLDKAEDESERLSRYLTIGDIYYEEGLYDSALRYLKPVFEKQETAALRVQVAGILHDIYSDQRDDENADKYAHYIVSQKKSEGENMVLVSKLEGLYQDYLHKKQEKQAEESREQSVKKTAGIIVPITVMVVLAVFILSKLKQKKLLKEQQREADRMLESKERSHQMEIESERQAHQVQQAALSGRLRRSNEELRELKGQIRWQEDADAKSEYAPSFAEEPICRLIMERVNEGQFMSQVDYKIYKDYALNKEQLSQLRNAADGHFNQFTIRVSQAHPELTRLDLDYCCLYLLGLTDADISALMQRAYNTVNERNSKLRRVLGSEKPVAVTLQAIANELVL